MNRTSVEISRTPPTLRNAWVSTALRSLLWAWRLSSAISSRKTVPELATSSSPGFWVSPPGERPLFVAEELGLDQRLGQTRAVDVGEGSGGAMGHPVDAAGDDVLAGSGLTVEGHGRVGLGHRRDEFTNPCDGFTGADELRQDLPVFGCPGSVRRAVDGDPIERPVAFESLIERVNSTSMETGFGRKLSAPRSMASTTVRVSLCPVRMITEMSSSLSLIFGRTSIPSASGRPRSRRMISGTWVSRCSKAAAAVATASTACPSACNHLQSISDVRRSSSTTRIRPAVDCACHARDDCTRLWTARCFPDGWSVRIPTLADELSTVGQDSPGD